MEILYIICGSIILITIFCCSQSLKVMKSKLADMAISFAKAEERVKNLIAEKEALSNLLKQERDRLLEELKQERRHLAEANQSLESAKVYYKTQQEKINDQKIEIEKLQLRFNKEFELIASKILDDKTLRFTEVNKANLDLLLNPLKENIKAFEDKVEKVYKAESDERNVLKGELGKLIELNRQISQEAHNLTRALKADTKKQGNWGEFV